MHAARLERRCWKVAPSAPVPEEAMPDEVLNRGSLPRSLYTTRAGSSLAPLQCSRAALMRAVGVAAARERAVAEAERVRERMRPPSGADRV